jgi:hypothetical protein
MLEQVAPGVDKSRFEELFNLNGQKVIGNEDIPYPEFEYIKKKLF